MAVRWSGGDSWVVFLICFTRHHSRGTGWLEVVGYRATRNRNGWVWIDQNRTTQGCVGCFGWLSMAGGRLDFGGSRMVNEGRRDGGVFGWFHSAAYKGPEGGLLGAVFTTGSENQGSRVAVVCSAADYSGDGGVSLVHDEQEGERRVMVVATGCRGVYVVLVGQQTRKIGVVLQVVRSKQEGGE